MKLKASILLIEDNEALRKLLSTYFSDLDFELNAVKDGLAGMKYLFSVNTPDILILSIDIVGMSAFELIEQVRANGLIGAIPIIIISSENDESIQQRCFDLGTDAFFTKPFSPDSLHNKVLELVPVPVYES